MRKLLLTGALFGLFSSVSPLPARAAITQAQTEALGNGVTLVSRPDALAPQASFSLLLRVGASDEAPETAGWRRLLINAMLRGGPKDMAREGLESENLSRASEALGGELGATVGDDFVEIWGQGESAHIGELMALALNLWRDPRLNDADLDSSRDRQKTQLGGDNLDLAGRTTTALRSQLYRNSRGELAAYGLPDMGTAESLQNLTNERLRELYATRLRNATAVVGLAGDFDRAAIRERLENLPAVTPRPPAQPYFQPPDPAKQPALVVREFPTTTAWVFVSYPLPGYTASDAPAMRLLTAALGDSRTARLPIRLLNKNLVDNPNAALSVSAQFVPRRFAGELILFAQTGPQGIESVKNALLDEIRKLRDTPLSPVELRNAKDFLRGSWAVERENGRERAFQSALAPVLNAPADTLWPARVESVTPAQLQAAAQKFLKAYAVALVMPQN